MAVRLWISVDFLGEELASGFLDFVTPLTKDDIKRTCVKFVRDASGIRLNSEQVVCRVTRPVGYGKYSDILNVAGIQDMEELKIKLIMLNNIGALPTPFSSPSLSTVRSAEDINEASSETEDDGELPNPPTPLMPPVVGKNKSPIRSDVSDGEIEIINCAEPLIEPEPGDGDKSLDVVKMDDDKMVPLGTSEAEETAVPGLIIGENPEKIKENCCLVPDKIIIDDCNSAENDGNVNCLPLCPEIAADVEKEGEEVFCFGLASITPEAIANVEPWDTLVRKALSIPDSDEPPAFPPAVKLCPCGRPKSILQVALSQSPFIRNVLIINSVRKKGDGSPSVASEAKVASRKRLVSPIANAVSPAPVQLPAKKYTAKKVKLLAEPPARSGRTKIKNIVANVSSPSTSSSSSVGVTYRHRMFSFADEDLYGVRKLILESSAGNSILEELEKCGKEPDSFEKLSEMGRSLLIETCGLWLNKSCKLNCEPTIEERALMAQSIVAAFPMLSQRHKSFPFQWIYNPRNQTGALAQWFKDNKARVQQKPTKDFVRRYRSWKQRIASQAKDSQIKDLSPNFVLPQSSLSLDAQLQSSDNNYKSVNTETPEKATTSTSGCLSSNANDSSSSDAYSTVGGSPSSCPVLLLDPRSESPEGLFRVELESLDASLRPFVFDKKDAFDVLSFLSRSRVGNQVLKRFTPEAPSVQFVIGRKMLIRMCAGWLMEICEVKCEPATIELARMAFSIIYAFPFFGSPADGPLGYEHLYNPLTNHGYLMICVRGRKRKVSVKSSSAHKRLCDLQQVAEKAGVTAGDPVPAAAAACSSRLESAKPVKAMLAKRGRRKGGNCVKC